MGKVICEICKKKCKGQAIKLSEGKFLHLKCFNCKACSKQLSSSDFYTKDGAHYCVDDYRRMFAARCAGCNECVEGEAVTALGRTFHQQCLRCTNCGTSFGAGDKVTFQGTQHLCHACLTQAAPGSPARAQTPGQGMTEPLMAAQRELTTSTPVRPQEIGLRPGQISSPDSDYFTDMKDFTSDRSPISPMSATSGYKSEPSYDHADNKGYLSPHMHFMHYRSASPGSMSHTSAKSKDSSGSFGSSRRGASEVDYGKFYRSSFLEKRDGYKRGPSINTGSNEKPRQHYHWPEGFSYRKPRTDLIRPKKKAKTGASKQLADSRRRSEPYKPYKNQDAIQLSKIPDAQKHESEQVLPIERADWPAPPDPAAAYPEILREHRRRRRSSRGDTVDGATTPSGRQSVDNKENQPLANGSIQTDGDEEDDDDRPPVDPRFEKDIEHLSKIPESGTARIFIEELKKKKTLEPPPLDPWSSSRSPSAAIEPPYKTRYESPIFASPSRDLELLARLPSLDESYSEIKYRTMTPPAAHFLAEGKFYEAPKSLVRKNSAPRPGYGLKSHALEMRNGYVSDSAERYYSRRYSDPRRPESSSAVLERTSCHSSRSDLEEYDANTGLRRNSRLRSTAMSEGRQTPNFHGRRSVPLIFKIEEPPKTFPYEQLRLSNKNRPQGLDNSRLEENLTKEDFEEIFHMPQSEFYHLPEWKRNDMKKRAELF